jgi:hypothetical protein
MADEKCIARVWPQARANVASLTPSGAVKWLRWWDPARQVDPEWPTDTIEYVAVCVTESHLVAVYRVRSTNAWYLSSLNLNNGSPHLEHFDLSITDATSLGLITFTPLRNDVHIGLPTSGNKERVYSIDSSGAVAFDDSAAYDSGHSPTSRFMLPNGELVTFTGAGSTTVMVTDQFGEVWRASAFSDAGGVAAFAKEDSTATGVAYFMRQSGAGGEWEWWKIDSFANTIALTAAGQDFAAPPAVGSLGEVAKVAADRVWVYSSTSGSQVVQFRNIVDDTADVLFEVVPSDFDTGGHGFTHMQNIYNLGGVSSGRFSENQKPGHMIDASGRFYCGALDPTGFMAPGAARYLAVDESDNRHFGSALEFTGSSSAFNRPVVVADGGAMFYAGGLAVEESDTPDENGNAVNVADWAGVWNVGDTELEPDWRRRVRNQSNITPMTWLTENGEVIAFETPNSNRLTSPIFVSRYWNRSTRMLDVTQKV